MSNIKISTNELENKISIINSYIDKLEKNIDKTETILKNLSYKNNTYYSSTSINLYNHFIENINNIRNLHNSYYEFINSLKLIIETYEKEENNLLKQVENISSIHINEWRIKTIYKRIN